MSESLYPISFPPMFQAQKYLEQGFFLHAAAYEGRVEDITTLLNENPSLKNQEDKFGDTALFIAIKCGQLNAVQVLLEPYTTHSSTELGTLIAMALLNNQESVMCYLTSVYLKLPPPIFRRTKSCPELLNRTWQKSRAEGSFCL